MKTRGKSAIFFLGLLALAFMTWFFGRQVNVPRTNLLFVTVFLLLSILAYLCGRQLAWLPQENNVVYAGVLILRIILVVGIFFALHFLEQSMWVINSYRKYGELRFSVSEIVAAHDEFFWQQPLGLVVVLIILLAAALCGALSRRRRSPLQIGQVQTT